jgi:hypothetical protein
MNIEQLLEGLNNPINDTQRLDVLRYVLENDVDVNIKLESVKYFNELHESFNQFIRENGIDESCVVGPTDTAAIVRKKCKKAFKHKQKYHPIYRTYVHAAAGGTGAIGGMMESSLGGHNYHPNGDYSVSYFAGPFRKRTPPEEKKTFTHRIVDPEAGFFPEEEEERTLQEKKKTSTERVRRYYKRHPEKVRKYLRKTAKDRAARNRDRRKAVEKYGKKKMKNHDVHHPNGAQNGNWKLAKKDHGRDKKNESVTISTGKITCRFCNWSWNTTDGGEHPYTCHKCWNDNTQIFLTENRIHENIGKFVEYVGGHLKLKNTPTVKVVDKLDGSYSSLGSYDPAANLICVVVKGRLLADILRTIAHELVHAKQMQMGLIKNPAIDGKTGSRIENSAHALAGIVMRNYGQLNKEIFLSERLIVEGGGGGHMMSVHENRELTFGEMKEIVDQALVGQLDSEGPVTEKLDGQNITFTVREDGTVVFARNKGHIKNQGRNALDVAGMRQMFAGRGDISTAFTSAAEDLQAAVEKLTPEQRQEMFSNGSKFMNVEIIFPDTQNVIPYGKSVLVMHGTIEFDEDGNEVGRNNEDGRLFTSAVVAAGADRQATFGIEGPRTIALSDADQEKYAEQAEKHKSTLDRLASDFDLDDNSTLADYSRAWWGREIDRVVQRDGISITPEQRDGLISRWADGDKKAIGVKDFKDSEQKEWFRQFESEELADTQKRMIKPVEYTFLRVGTGALGRATNFMAANNPGAAARIKQDTLEAIRAIQDSDDPNLLAKLQRELDRLDAMGMDNIVPSEGIVFMRNGVPHKFTGPFAPINQITGTFKFGMPTPTNTTSPEEPSTEDSKTDISDIVKDMDFQPTTKQPIQYSPSGEVSSQDDMDAMAPLSFATNTVADLPVVTITADGKETQNVAGVGDIIMSGPSGEKYVVKKEKFDKLYTDGPDGTKIPEQSPRQVTQYTGEEEVTFTAPWGEDMVLKLGDYLVRDGDSGYYRIAKQEYEETYNPPGVTEPEKTQDGWGDEWGADIPDEWREAGWKIDTPDVKVSDESPPEDASEDPEPKSDTTDDTPPKSDGEKPSEPASGTSPRTVAVFVGRFQPFHAGHFSVYQELVDRFGKDNVYIGSSDVTDPIRSPFPFDAKQQIMMKMFGIPEDRIVQVKNPYAPKEITDNLPEDTVYVTAVSQKDAERLGGGKYFRDYDQTSEESRVGYNEGGYFIVAPEMELEIDGKNISGTQLRHVFGSPEISERAKQEIFTKIYGKFDPDIFGMVVKKTTEAEESARITASVDPDARARPTRKTAAASDTMRSLPSEDAEIVRQSGVLTQKIRNDDTGRNILVASALSKKYEGTSVQDAAKELLARTIEQYKKEREAQKSENIIIENILEAKTAKKIRQYLYTRDYTDEELDNEVAEYFENERTKNLFPKLAGDKLELRDMIEDADEIILDKKFLKMLANSDVPEVLSSDNPAKILKKIKDEHERNVEGLLSAIKNEEELPLPIVIQHPQGVYLVAGNTRLSVLASINHTMPVKLIKYMPDVDLDDDDDSSKVKMTDKEIRKARRKEFQAVLDTRIINPETGNKIKVNTAMDYNKNHPAHRVAMELIRSRMAGLSPTAGIPKKPKS